MAAVIHIKSIKRKTMQDQNFTTILLVDQTPEQAFDAINNISEGCNEGVEGNSKKLNDVFAVQFADMHYSK